jgi:hypothetical protein
MRRAATEEAALRASSPVDRTGARLAAEVADPGVELFDVTCVAVVASAMS